MEYSLFIDTPLALEDGVKTLLSNQTVGSISQVINSMGTLSHCGLGAGVQVEGAYVIYADPQRAQVDLQFGVVPTLRFLFQVDEFVYEKAGHHTGVTTMLQACTALLQNLTGNAVLVGKDMDLLFQRKENAVVLNTDNGFWNPFRISHLDLPHRFQQAASLS